VITGYLILKFAHIFIAIVALGTSAGLGIVLEFYGDHPTHGSFVLRMIRRLVVMVVMPGYLLMLVTGAWLAHLAWSLSVGWIKFAFGLWMLGAILLGISARVLRKQIALFEAGGPSTPAYRRTSLLGRGLGAGAGLVVVLILYLMVAKPGP